MRRIGRVDENRTPIDTGKALGARGVSTEIGTEHERR